MRKVNIPIFVPHKGCPHDCVFCNQKRITGQAANMTPEAAKVVLETALQTVNRTNTRVEAAFFGGSFTAIPQDEQEAFLRVVQPYIRRGQIDGIRLSTRPDCIEKENLAMLQEYGVTSIELGVQSTDAQVLRQSRRGHSASDVENAASHIRQFGMELGLQMMLGLPGDTREKSMKTAADIAALKPDTARIYPTLVIRDSALCDMYEMGRYTPLPLEDAVGWCAEIYTLFVQAGITVLRMGLMASEDLCEGNGIVAGPFHPAFGELVLSRLFLDKMRALLDGFVGKEAVLRVHPKDRSKAAGNRKQNIETIKNELDVKIVLIGDESVEPGGVVW